MSISDSWLTFTTKCRDAVSLWLCRASIRAWGRDDPDGWHKNISVKIKVDADIAATAVRMGLKI